MPHFCAQIEFAIECAEPHYYHGKALYQHVKATQDVFGCSSVEKNLQLIKERASGSSNEVHADESDAAEDDYLSRAWESLEVAKLCYEKNGPENHADALTGSINIQGNKQ